MNNAESSSPHAHWAPAITKIALLLILVGGVIFLFRSCHSGSPEGSKYTKLFIDGATTLTGTKRLQFATVNQNCTFEHSDLGGRFLPDVVVSAEAPVEFTYYVPFNDDWRIERDGQVLYVLAPTIEFNKPSVDASKIKYNTKDGSIFRNETKAQERLKERITDLAAETAKKNVQLVREQCRREVEGFVGQWAAKHFGSGTPVVKVYFPDEPLPPVLSGRVQLPKM